jgi:hypothetical protein
MCQCGLPLDPPSGDAAYWVPTVDHEPGPGIATMVRYGESPEFRRVVRSGDGWSERGCAVDGTGTPGRIAWQRAGRCWGGEEHPVVPVG